MVKLLWWRDAAKWICTIYPNPLQITKENGTRQMNTIIDTQGESPDINLFGLLTFSFYYGQNIWFVKWRRERTGIVGSSSNENATRSNKHLKSLIVPINVPTSVLTKTY